jgi:hypothetical protein
MPEFIYTHKKDVEEKYKVSPCPCCGGADLKFVNADEDWGTSREWAVVKCLTCGHTVELRAAWNGPTFDGSGLKCQLAAIQEWNAQYAQYRGRVSHNTACRLYALLERAYAVLCADGHINTEYQNLRADILEVLAKAKEERISDNKESEE